MLFMEHMKFHCNNQYFTDGSKEGIYGGAAVFDVVENLAHRYKIEGHLSIFSIEAIAILKALEKIKEKEDKNAVIYSDSKSVLQAIKGGDQSNGHLLEIRKQLDQLIVEDYRISLCWVPAHVGIWGNEKADEEAKRAVINGIILNPEIQFKEYITRTREYIKKKWSDEWKGSHSKLKRFKEKIGPIVKTGENRREEVIMRRLRMGHTEETHGYLLKKENPPICQMCNVIKTVYHLLYCCQISFFRSEDDPAGNQLGAVLAPDLAKWTKERQLRI